MGSTLGGHRYAPRRGATGGSGDQQDEGGYVVAGPAYVPTGVGVVAITPGERWVALSQRLARRREARGDVVRRAGLVSVE